MDANGALLQVHSDAIMLREDIESGLYEQNVEELIKAHLRLIEKFCTMAVLLKEELKTQKNGITNDSQEAPID
jgi:hypothetical protein